MPRAQMLASYIEWEDFGHKWKIDTLEPSESLPQGAEKAEVWRNENYELKAKISGMIEGSRIDIRPKVEAGSQIPLFKIKGSDEYGIRDYEIGSCAIGNILSSEWRDQTSNPPSVAYEAELLLASGAEWIAVSDDPSITEWLSEWYLNGPHFPMMYRRGSITKVTERYKRKRELPGNEEDIFEETMQIGGASFAFVETGSLSFLVQHTPKKLGPAWSECLSIEYRPVWGGIPDSDHREAIAAITSFLIGRELVNVGHTRFAADGRSISQVALNPLKDNLVCVEHGRSRSSLTP